jgi:hypothetical protein
VADGACFRYRRFDAAHDEQDNGDRVKGDEDHDLPDGLVDLIEAGAGDKDA